MDRNPVFTTICEEPAEMMDIHRHVLCPCYDDCLDEAVLRNRSFDCRQCLFKEKNIIVYRCSGRVAV